MKTGNSYKKLAAISAAALILTAGLTIEGSMAYFTTYTEAEGSQIVSLGAQTEIEETVSEKTKHVTVKNTSSENDCFVRVKVFSGQNVTCTPSGSSWTYDEEDGYWYYGQIVAPGASTEVLDVSIKLENEEIKDFNVVVVQECTPVMYDKDGNPAADWDLVYTEYAGEEA
ncbi:MAG: hypothetical protein ACOYBL_06915 [Lachnospiraceae bacterium]|jgi:hypothetical protein